MILEDSQRIKTSLRERLETMTALDAVSGHEQSMVAYLLEALAPLADDVRVDTMGNVYATVNGQGQGPHLMLEAHSDEIGAMVKSIDANGFIRMLGVGGVSAAMLVGRNVRIHGQHGVIGVKSGHLQTPEERRSVAEISALYVDMGVDSAEQVAEMGIGIGDAIAYDSPLQRFGQGDRVSGKAIDNRIGCAVLLQVLEEWGQRSAEGRAPAGTLSVVICVQEEIGLRGAHVAAYTARPDYAIAVDTFMSGDTPDLDYYRDLSAAIGQGPVLLMANSAHMSHPAVNRYVRAAAQSVGVPLQDAIIGQGMAATDAGAIHLTRQGVPSAGLGLARRYSHTPICTLDLNDAAGAVALLLAFVSHMGQHTDLGFLSEGR